MPTSDWKQRAERAEARVKELEVKLLASTPTSSVDLEANRVAEAFMRRTKPPEVKHRLVREIDAEQRTVERIAAWLEAMFADTNNLGVIGRGLAESVRSGVWKKNSDADE